MNFKNALLSTLTFLIAIQFIHSSDTNSTGRLNSVQSTPIIAPVVEPLQEEPTKDYYFKPSIGAGTYYAGQCVWGVAKWVYVPPNMGNANQWDDRARVAGYTVTTVPAIGSVAVSNAGYYGHVELVIDKTDTMVKTRGMNVRGPYSVAERWKPYSYWDSYIYF